MPTVTIDPRLLEALAGHGEEADRAPTWPESSWDLLTKIGATRWCIPNEHGGDALAHHELLAGYAELASACLTSCFLMSQRDAACRRLRDSDNQGPAKRLLPKLASGELFATVGIAQLTTSRQHGKPAMTVTEKGGRHVLNGVIPWVTGASRADYFITGGMTEDHQQLLVVVPGDAEGINVDPPMGLMALQGSLTTSVRCHEVRIEKENILAGPAEAVMKSGKGGPGGLETSALALGLAQAAITRLEGEAEKRDEWSEPTARLAQRRERLWNLLQQHAREGATPEALVELRAGSNSLVLRATQTLLTASKGTGFLRGHPAQRWVRQAMFFLVWACPRPTVDATVASLLPCE